THTHPPPIRDALHTGLLQRTNKISSHPFLILRSPSLPLSFPPSLPPSLYPPLSLSLSLSLFSLIPRICLNLSLFFFLLSLPFALFFLFQSVFREGWGVFP